MLQLRDALNLGSYALIHMVKCYFVMDWKLSMFKISCLFPKVDYKIKLFINSYNCCRFMLTL